MYIYPRGRVSYDRCLCGALGVSLEASNQELTQYSNIRCLFYCLQKCYNHYTSDYLSPQSRMNPNRCLCRALDIGLEASHQNSFYTQTFYYNHNIIEIKLRDRSITFAPSNFGLLVIKACRGWVKST